MLGRPLEAPEQAFADKSLLEILDGLVMVYSLSVHQQLGKVSAPSAPTSSAPTSLPPSSSSAPTSSPCTLFQMVVVSDDLQEYAVALKDTEDKMSRCPPRVSQRAARPAVFLS